MIIIVLSIVAWVDNNHYVTLLVEYLILFDFS